MKLFVDTGNLKEVEALAALGILDGATTNSSLLAKEGGDARQILDAIYLPPAGQGDVVSAMSRYRPDVIGLIDGVF